MPFDWDPYLKEVEFKDPIIIKKKRGQVSPYQILDSEIHVPKGKAFKSYYYGIAIVSRLRSYSDLEKRLFLNFQIVQQADPHDWLLQLSRVVEALSKNYGEWLLFELISDERESAHLHKIIEDFYDQLAHQTPASLILPNLNSAKTEDRLNVYQAAEYLDYAPSYIYKLTSQNKIPHHKPPEGRKITFYKEELDEWLKEGYQLSDRADERAKDFKINKK